MVLKIAKESTRFRRNPRGRRKSKRTAQMFGTSSQMGAFHNPNMRLNRRVSTQYVKVNRGISNAKFVRPVKDRRIDKAMP